MKKIISMILVITLLSTVLGTALPSNVYAETPLEDFEYNVIQEQYAEITGYTGENSKVVIPAQIGGYPVEVIGINAFYDDYNIQEVVLPDTIKVIDEQAFFWCMNLTKVEFNEGLEEIGTLAFSRTSLNEIQLPEGIRVIGRSAFEGTKIKEAVLPDSVSEIGGWAFCDCENLEYFKYPMGLTTADQKIFENCPKLIHIDVPEGVTYLPDYLFYGANNLSSVTLPESLTDIGVCAFYGAGITEIEIPSEVKTIGDSAFSSCDVLEEISFNNKLEEIGANAFGYCLALTKVTLPDSVRHIGDGAFVYCENLSEINYPSGLESSEYRVFEGCDKLTDMTVPEGVTVLADNIFSEASGLKRVLLPESLVEIPYLSFSGCEGLEKVWIDKNTTIIAQDAFRDCKGLTIHGYEGTYAQEYAINNSIPFSTESITAEFNLLGGTVKDEAGNAIEEFSVSVFNKSKMQNMGTVYTDEEGNWSLKDTKIGDTYIVRYYHPLYSTEADTVETTIEDTNAVALEAVATKIYDEFTPSDEGDFKYSVVIGNNIEITEYTGNDTKVVIPETIDGYNVYRIGRYAFYSNQTIEEVVFPDNLKEIDSSAFDSCSNLKNVVFNEGLKIIGNCAFTHTGLQEVRFPNGLEEIVSSAFSGTKLKKVILPDTLSAIGDSAFGYCDELEYVKYPLGVENAGTDIFASCKKLTRVDIPEGVTFIPYGMFYRATSLESIKLPNSTEYIRDNAFYNCTSLKNISLPEGLIEIGYSAFERCSGLKKIKLPESLTIMGSNVFKKCINLEEINYPINLTDSGTNIYEGCEKLTQIVIPDGVTTIPGYAFYGADYLESILLPDSITSIGECAFYDCDALKSITISDQVEEIGWGVFDGCDNLTVYCSESSMIIPQLVENEIPFVLNKTITSYDYFEYDETHYYNTTDSSVGYMAFELSYKMTGSEEKISNREILISIPKSAELMENTVRLNGELIDYYYDESLLIIYTDAHEGTVSYCIRPNEYDDLISYAKIDFYEYDESWYIDERSEIIGVLNCSVPSLMLKADERTGSGEVKAEGMTLPSAQVDLYVDGVYAKSVTALKTGKFFATVEIPSPKDYKKYTVTAKIQKDGVEIEESVEVMYESSTPALKSFVMEHGNDKIELVSERGTKPFATFVPGSDFEFEVKFENPEAIDKVYITSTRNNQKVFMDAVWNEKTESYVAEGYFENTGANYVPGEINVEYVPKLKTVPITDKINAEELADYMHPSVKDCTTNVKTHTNEYYEAEINVAPEISDLIGDEIDFVVETLDKEYNDIPLSDLMAVKDNYFSYFVEEDGEKYIFNLDFTDPETLNMVVHDISNDKQLNYILDFMDNSTYGNPSKALEISEVLGKASFVTGTLADVYDIQNSDEQLRDNIMRSGMTSAEREVALKKAKDLKRDRETFLLASTVITVATMGLAGPSAILFGVMFGAIGASSSFFWEARMAGILGGTGFGCNWAIDPSGYVYEGITGNRLEGVTATAYWIAPEYIDEFGNGDESMAVEWDAYEYEQMNPLITNSNGQYAWDVPEGLWQVKFEKDGYETAYSQWLPVPPPQTEVHMGMISYEEPKINSASWDGDLLKVTFSKPLIPETIGNIEIFDENGNKMELTATFDETQTDLSGVNYCNVIEYATDVKPSSIKVNSQVLSYAGVGMADTAMRIADCRVSLEFETDSKLAVVTSKKNISNVMVYAACYKKNQLTDLKLAPMNLTIGENEVLFDELDIQEADTIKIMVWENSGDVKPICELLTIDM